jgi:ribonuclease Z
MNAPNSFIVHRSSFSPPMSDSPIRIRTPHFTIDGRSRAGHETWFRVRELGIGLDVGRGHDALIGIERLFVTHAHLDHAAGIAWYGSQRRLQRLHPAQVFVPAESADDFRALIALQEKLTGAALGIDIEGMAEGDVRRLGRTLAVRAHRATHRVAARAYEFLERRHHLKPEFAGRDAQEIAAMRHDGVDVAEEVEVPVLFYTGDTDRGILERNERIYKAEVLMIECSFVAEGHEERAAKYRHIHFDDIIAFAERFENQIIVLTHFSRRYGRDEIRDTIARRCPEVLRERLRLALPDGWQTVH